MVSSEAGAASEDQELGAALAGRDRIGVLDALYRHHSARVFRFCQRLIGEPALAEEIAQEAFEKTLGRVGFFRRPAPPALRAFLYRTAHHLCVSQARRRDAERRALRRLAAPPPTAERDGQAVDGARVRAALGHLDEEDRAVLLLWAEAELSVAEVARVLELPESTCRDRFRRALDALVAELGCAAETSPRRQAQAPGRAGRAPAVPDLLRCARASLDPEP